MPQTRDYAKLGQVTWRAEVGLNDGAEPHAETVAELEFPGACSKGLAKASVTRILRGHRNPPERPGIGRPFYWGTIRRGTYRDDSFDDIDDGRVLNAAWEPDRDTRGEPVADHAHLGDDGQVVWDGDAEPPQGEQGTRLPSPGKLLAAANVAGPDPLKRRLYDGVAVWCCTSTDASHADSHLWRVGMRRADGGYRPADDDDTACPECGSPGQQVSQVRAWTTQGRRTANRPHLMGR